MADTLVMVEFCGGPHEGRRLTFSTSALLPTLTYRIPYPLAHTIWTARPAPRYPTHRTAVYILHRDEAGRCEYVHAGNTDD